MVRIGALLYCGYQPPLFSAAHVGYGSALCILCRVVFRYHLDGPTPKRRCATMPRCSNCLGPPLQPLEHLCVNCHTNVCYGVDPRCCGADFLGPPQKHVAGATFRFLPLVTLLWLTWLTLFTGWSRSLVKLWTPTEKSWQTCMSEYEKKKLAHNR